jgi:small subunit ribosomal protein S17
MADEETTDKDFIEEPPSEPTDEAASADAADDAPTPEAAAADADAPTEAEDDRAASAAGSAPPAAPAEAVAPKERRRRARAAKAAAVPARAARSPEERHAERVADRRRKAEVRRAGRARAKAKASHTGAGSTPPREHIPGVQKVRQGIVVSDKADKTITVRIDTARRHRRYEKIVRTSRTLHAHDESNDAHLGDTVVVREARPLSRTKRWRLVRVVERAK